MTDEQKRELSTRLSPLYRWGIPALLTVVALGAVLWASFFTEGSPDPARVVIAVIIAAASVFYARWLDRAKRVWIDANNLYVSDFSRETEIPLTDIKTIKTTTWIRPTRISVWFNKPTIFGDKISFFPTRAERDALPEHPALVELANAASGN